MAHQHGDEPGTTPYLYLAHSADPDPRNSPRIRYLLPRQWYRVVCLTHARGDMTDELAEMLKHASLAADKRGIIHDVPAWLKKYGASQGRSERWAYLQRRPALTLGWLRRAQGPAPGIPACYVLQLPMSLIPGGLPDDLTDQLRMWDEDAAEDPTEGVYHGHLSAVPTTMVSKDPPAKWPQFAPEPSNLPPVEPEEIAAARASLNAILTGLQTSPYTRGPDIPPLSYTYVVGGIKDAKATNIVDALWPFGGRPPHPDEYAAASGVFRRCEAIWQQQRGPAGGLSVDEAVSLAPWVVLALRRTTPGQVEELLGPMVRGARSLPKVLWKRLTDYVRSTRDHQHERPHRTAPADEFGAGYARMRTEKDAYADAIRDRHHAYAEGCREYPALIRANRELADQGTAQASDLGTGPAWREPDHLHRASLSVDAAAIYDAQHQAAPRRTSLAAAIAQGRTDRAARTRGRTE